MRVSLHPTTNRFLLGALVGLTIVGQPVEEPRLQLRRGENYFRVDGRPGFVLGRNPAGANPQAYDDHFRHAAAAGERFMRIHFTFLPPGEKAGQIDAGMLKAWDSILDAAENQGLAVLPVLGVWSDWNDGSGNLPWHTWDRNPYNVERGGPAKRPRELFDDTDCQKLWLKRLEMMVKHWSPRRAIVGWEIFSELDLVTGGREESAVVFAERAAVVIRAADPWKRPVTASQAGMGEWPTLLRNNALDFIEIHPYADGAFGGRLDDLIISGVRNRLAKYGKPVLIGESGLSAAPPRHTLDVSPRAEVGIRHAIWAAVVSGAMNGRMLWWQDGYDRFEKVELGLYYEDTAVAATAFVRGVDYGGFAPVACVLSPGLKGAMIGNDSTRLGWFRDVACEPPNWPVKPTAGQTVSVDAPGGAWDAEYVDPGSGKTTRSVHLAVVDRRLRIVLPQFEDAIAVRLTRAPGR